MKINSLVEDGVKLTDIFLTFNLNFTRKQRLACFLCKILTETPIETKRKTFRSIFEREHNVSVIEQRRRFVATWNQGDSCVATWSQGESCVATWGQRVLQGKASVARWVWGGEGESCEACEGVRGVLFFFRSHSFRWPLRQLWEIFTFFLRKFLRKDFPESFFFFLCKIIS